eukprot:PhM_4_TR3349/c0_g1_i1/m.94614
MASSTSPHTTLIDEFLGNRQYGPAYQHLIENKSSMSTSTVCGHVGSLALLHLEAMTPPRGLHSEALDSRQERKEIIDTTLEILNKCIKTLTPIQHDENDMKLLGDVHSYYAMFLNKKAGFYATPMRVLYRREVKDHLVQGLTLNPHNAIALNFAGNFCRRIAERSFLEDSLDCLLHQTLSPLTSTNAEALQYFAAAQNNIKVPASNVADEGDGSSSSSSVLFLKNSISFGEMLESVGRYDEARAVYSTCGFALSPVDRIKVEQDLMVKCKKKFRDVWKEKKG